jgi:hypothetical protein
MKNLLNQLLALVESHETTVIGSLVGLVVLVAGDLHIVLSQATVTSVLAPVIAGLLAEIRAKTKAKPAPAPAPAAK